MMGSSFRSDLANEAKFIPRLAVAMLLWFAIREVIDDPQSDFWAVALFVGEFAASIAATWLLFSLFVVRPRLTLTWGYLNGNEIKGRTLHIEATPAVGVRTYSLVMRYEIAGSPARVIARKLERVHPHVTVSCDPKMAALFVDSSVTDVTKGSGGAFGWDIGDEDLFDRVNVGVAPEPVEGQTQVRFSSSLECNHIWSWHEKLLRRRQNLDDVYVVYSEQEFA